MRVSEEILAELDYTPRCVMEPFSGTGTTELVCANKGISSFALEINPFLVWLGNAKLGFYQRDKVEEFLSIANTLMQHIEEYVPTDFPPIYNIYRWWNPPQAEFLAKLKSVLYVFLIKSIKNSGLLSPALNLLILFSILLSGLMAVLPISISSGALI